MGFFYRKYLENVTNPADYIKCDRFIQNPPKTYKCASDIHSVSREQHSKYLEVLHYFQAPNLLLPSKSGRKVEDSDALELSSYERFWITRECILRYLRATDWNVQTAIKRILKTLVWRREFRITGDPNIPNNLDRVDVEKESLTGKQVCLGYDRDSRPIFILKNGYQNTHPSFSQVQYLVYFMEAVISIMPVGVELLSMLIDYKKYTGAGLINAKSPPLSLALQILNIIQDHYPERLGRAFFVNMAWYAWTFLKLIHPFINPKTRSKLVYDESLLNYIDPDQLEVKYGGKLDFVYNHELYWPNFNKIVNARRTHQYDRFLKFGACVGLSEFDLKGEHEEMLYSPEFAKLN